jgi:hypothetical protein
MMSNPEVRHINLSQLGDYIANDWDTGRGTTRVRNLTREMYGKDDDTFKNIEQSVAQHGIKEPLFVTHEGENKYLIDGHRRAVLAMEYGIDNIPVTSDWRNTE